MALALTSMLFPHLSVSGALGDLYNSRSHPIASTQAITFRKKVLIDQRKVVKLLNEIQFVNHLHR